MYELKFDILKRYANRWLGKLSICTFSICWNGLQDAGQLMMFKETGWKISGGGVLSV